jgi:hypothetical protein
MSYVIEFILNVAGANLPIRRATDKGYAALHGPANAEGKRSSGYSVIGGRPKFVGISLPALADNLPTTATLHAVTKDGKRGKVLVSLALTERKASFEGKADKVYREADATLTEADGTERSVTVRFSVRGSGPDWQAAVKVSAPYEAKADAEKAEKVPATKADRLAAL